jgi:diaminopimelate decarboxylase
MLTARFGGVTADGELSIGGFPVSRLAAQYGTPCFVYSGEMIEEQVRRVQAALGQATDVYFSIKANPSLGVCQLLARLGVGAELASGGELLLALKAGFEPRRIIFAGPGKTDEELELAVRHRIGAVNVESAGELARLRAIAGRAGQQVSVGLRINPSLSLLGANMRMGGGTQQFGIDEEQVAGIVQQYRHDHIVDITGIHVYTGTQIFDVGQLLEHCAYVLDMAGQLAAQLGRPLKQVDLGGGFGVPYFDKTGEFDLQAFGAGYAQLLERYRRDDRFAGTRFVIELGRYLVAHAGLYITRVVDVKRSRDKTYVVTDGGMNHHTMATGNFGQVFRKPYPVAVVNRMAEPPAEHMSVVGPCCTPLDVIGNDLQLASARPGDLVGVFYSGAYGYSASSLAFLSHPTPAEVLVWRGRCHLLRAAGRMDQVLDGQCGLAPDEDE